MAFSNQELAKITGYTGLFGKAAKEARQGTHQDHVIALGEKVKQGDRDAFNRLNQMNQYFDQQGMGGYKFNVPSLPEPLKDSQPPQPIKDPPPIGQIPRSPVGQQPGLIEQFDTGLLGKSFVNLASAAIGGSQPQQQTFDKARLAQITGYNQTPAFRGFGGTVDTAMGQGRHGNHVFDLLGQVRRGGEDAADARAKLEAMNAYFDSIPGYSGAKIDIDGASFSDKPVNRELRQVTGYTGQFGPDAKEGEKFGDYVKSLRDNKDFDTVAKVNQVLEKFGYGTFKVDPTETLLEEAVDKGYSGDPDDIDAIGRYLGTAGSRSSYVDAYGQLTPTGRLEERRDAPTLAPGTELSLFQYEVKPDELLNTQDYLTDPTKFNSAVAQAAVTAAEAQTKTVAANVSPVTAAQTVAEAKLQAAEQQGLTDLVTAQTGTVDANATVQGQLNNLMAQFEGGQVPAFAAGAIRVAEQRLAARGMGASSMAGAALVQAAMEASVPIAAADAETYRRMAELNLNNRQQAEVLNSQMTLQLDLQNLSNEQQAAVINEQNRVQAIFTDQAAENTARQFNAQSAQQNDQFFANMFTETAKFNSAQQNAIAQYNAGQTNAINEFNATLSSNREQFETKNRIVIDQANATYRRAVNTGNTALQNAENEFNVRNLFNISEFAYANLLQQHRDELAFARQQYQNRDKYFANLSLASIQHDKNIDSSFIDSIGSIVSTVGTGWLFKTLGI